MQCLRVQSLVTGFEPEVTHGRGDDWRLMDQKFSACGLTDWYRKTNKSGKGKIEKKNFFFSYLVFLRMTEIAGCFWSFERFWGSEALYDHLPYKWRRCKNLPMNSTFKMKHQIISLKTKLYWPEYTNNTHYCPWCNGYRRGKWTQRHEFKSWTDCISHNQHKGMNPIILPPAMGK